MARTNGGTGRPRARFLILVLAVAAGPTMARAGTAQEANADELFAAGRIPEARAAYEARRVAAPSDSAAVLRLGLVALWENRLEEARELLATVTTPDSMARTALEGRAGALYRERRFEEAAPLYRGLGRHAMAEKLESLATPYRATIPREGTALTFPPDAVLPVLRVRVNGQEADFLLDTGAGETILDPELAAAVGARTFGADSATYAGGRQATFVHGAVDSIGLGTAVVRDVPVHIQSTRAYAPAAGGRPVRGIVGTGLLAQFRATIDFGGHSLFLAPREAPAPPGTAMPFWLLGDHFITVQATAGRKALPVLLIFDTGLAMPGGAFVPAASLLAELGVEPEGPTISGIGGGGAVTVTPFTFGPPLTIGPLERTGILSLAGAFPAVLERRFGVRIAGLVSHGFFSGRRVTLDFAAMRMIIDDP